MDALHSVVLASAAASYLDPCRKLLLLLLLLFLLTSAATGAAQRVLTERVRGLILGLGGCCGYGCGGRV